MSAEADVIEGEAEEVGREIAVAAPAPSLAVTPNVQAGELVERMSVIRDAMDNAMLRDTDYGVIPGTNKPALLKPGAEKLGVLFQLDIQIENVKTWGPGDHLTVESKAVAYYAPTGARLGSGEGICTTREKKYAKRQQQRTCPDCGEAAVIKGKAEYGGGWLCFKKKGGCGHKWPDGAAEIEGQEVGEIENPDLPDTWNTVVKMAEKRARVDAVLAVTGASALFTQDQDDQIQRQDAPAGEPDAPANVPAPDAPPPDELLEHAKNCGLRSPQIMAWVRDNVDRNAPNPESVADLLAALERMDGRQAAKFTTDATEYASAAAAKAREASLQHDAEEQAA